MKRRDMLRHLSEHGCALVREGGSHSWWHNTSQNKRSAIPRHNEISDHLARKICKDLGVPQPSSSPTTRCSRQCAQPRNWNHHAGRNFRGGRGESARSDSLIPRGVSDGSARPSGGDHVLAFQCNRWASEHDRRIFMSYSCEKITLHRRVVFLVIRPRAD